MNPVNKTLNRQLKVLQSDTRVMVKITEGNTGLYRNEMSYLYTLTS